MIFKVYFQESKQEAPVRENTKTIYVEADSERDVRLSLKDRPYNIEFIQSVQEDYLEYEKQNPNYAVEN
ncbi:DNA-dependent RNA polymerase subunit epsilon [Bacillus sp. 2205SS5-2]|uniref:DNA-dependent RNA polymerase subunit epsilon n=1 Tax=Bacillus sp. 2205SS5-2 TaxID=3109031 RepID=UPI00300732E9